MKQPGLACAAALCLAAPAFAQPTTQSIGERITEAARASQQRLVYDGVTFSGPAWDTLLAEARDSAFVLIGEEHGIAECPPLVSELFVALRGDGYEHVVVEVSPHVASALEAAARSGGLDGLRGMYATAGHEPAFFNMRQEAQMVVDLAEASEPGVLWGVDYEVAGDRLILDRLEELVPEGGPAGALAGLRAASDASWERYLETRNPGFIFSFSGEPALVEHVEHAWRDRGAEATWLLDSLRETLAINQLFVQGRGWASNLRRAEHIRGNFLRHWERANADGEGPPPKVIAKMGASHLVRGRSFTEVFDLGALLPEIAALRGERALGVLVLPGADSEIARLNPSTFTVEPGPAKDGYAEAAAPLIEAADPFAFTLIDLRPIREIVGSKEGLDPKLAKLIHGFDLAIVMTASTPSEDLDHPEPVLGD